MPTLEDDRLVFRFPQIEANASFSIDFQRTLRIPDTNRTYSLPPGLGSFPVRHADDYRDNLPEQTTQRGGVILPIWQAEAMWLNFHNVGPVWGLDFPVAIKIAAGKINAVTGEGWRPGLHRNPQDYMVSPGQPWLDGFAIEKGVIRQFVAMPLGDGYTAEEQLSSKAEWGGIQISVIPLKSAVWKRKCADWEKQQTRKRRALRDTMFLCEQLEINACMSPQMGLSPGGRMHQAICGDTFEVDDWDVAAADRVFVTLLHAKDWKRITGEAAPNHPPTAKEYADAGLPWFDYYAADQAALPGGEKLGRLESLAKFFKKQTGVELPHSKDVSAPAPIPLGPAAKGPRPVRNPSTWEQPG